MLSLKSTLLFSFGILLLLATACNEPTSTTPDTQISVDEPTPVNSSVTQSDANQYLIQNNGFYGLLSGVPLVDRMERLEKGTLSDGEGDFDVYYIKGTEGEQIGYVLPHTQDETLIGSITISTPKAVTEDGIHIGSTFRELQAKSPAIQAYGSEVEGRTHAVRDREMFLLDVYETAYDLDESTIKEGAVIKQITIQQHRAE